MALFLLAVTLSTPCAAQVSHTNRFVPEMSAYSNSMTITCIAKMGALQLKDCEIAAFDKDGQCRGSQLSSIDQDGYVYLMVYGVASETLHFKIVTSEGQVLDCKETLSFKVDDEVGNLMEPFVFNVDLHDVNKDGKQSIADLVAIIHMLNNGDRTPYDVKAADLDGDGILTAKDLLLYRELLLGK